MFRNVVITTTLVCGLAAIVVCVDGFLSAPEPVSDSTKNRLVNLIQPEFRTYEVQQVGEVVAVFERDYFLNFVSVDFGHSHYEGKEVRGFVAAVSSEKLQIGDRVEVVEEIRRRTTPVAHSSLVVVVAKTEE